MPGISGLKLGKTDYLKWKNLSHILAGGNMDASAAKGRDELQQAFEPGKPIQLAQKGHRTMEKISLPKASVMTSPNPLTLVCTEKPDGTTNLATVSWWTYLSYNPGMIAYAMAKTSFSGEMVRNNHKVVLAIPGADIAKAVMGCGSTTGRNTDKVRQFDVELTGLEGSTIKIPVHSRVAIQCSLKEYHEVGDHYLYICNVEQVYGNEAEEAVFAWNGYGKIAPAKQA